MRPPSFKHISEAVVIFRNLNQTVNAFFSRLKIGELDTMLRLIAKLAVVGFSAATKVICETVPVPNNIIKML